MELPTFEEPKQAPPKECPEDEPPPKYPDPPAYQAEYDRDPIDTSPKFCDLFIEKLGKRRYFLYDWRIGLLLGVMSFALVIGILFGSALPNLVDRSNFEVTTCHSLQLFSSQYRCCKVGSCSCNECAGYLSCKDDLTRQPLNSTYCCGGYSCCGRCCATCTDRTCDKDGHCREYSYACRCRCCSEVTHETCGVDCGTCAKFMVLYYTEAMPLLNLTYTDDCGLDKFQCMFDLIGKYSAGNIWECWYNVKNPHRVRFSGIPPVNIAAWFFIALFGLVLAGVIGMYVLYPLGKVGLVFVDTCLTLNTT